MNLQKILTILIAVVGVIGFIIWIMIVKTDDNEGLIGTMIGLGYILAAVAALTAIIFSLVNIASDPVKIKKAGIAIVALLAALAIGYGLSEGQEVVDNGKVMATESSSKWVGTGLRVFYILIVVAFVTMIVSGVKKAIK